MPTPPLPAATGGNDILYGGPDNDILAGLTGDDLIYGGGGNDLIYGGDGSGYIYNDSSRDTIYGGNGHDLLHVYGIGAVLYGDEGDDILEMLGLEGPALSTADGGTGNDTLRLIDTSNAAVVGGDGRDLLEFRWVPLLIADDVTIDFDAGIARSRYGMNLTFSEFERLSVYLSLGNDVVTGSSQDDFLWVDAGANQVDARAGNDTVRYMIGEANTLEGGAGGADRLVAYGNSDGSPVYFIYDSYEGDVDDGQLSLITGFEAFDVVGFDGNDIISTGGGNDVLYGNGGDDTLAGKVGQDRLYGGSGNDDLNGGADNDLLEGGAGNDTMIGSSGRDQLTGGTGADQLFGGVEADWLNGGWGYDRLEGGDGADYFYHVGVAGHGTDWITDYSATEGDVLVSGITSSSRWYYQVNYAYTEGAGDADIAEAFVIYRPTGQILWAIVDGAGQDHLWFKVNGTNNGQLFDLMA